MVHQGDHDIKIVEAEEIRKKRMEIKYCVEVVEVNKIKVKDIYAKQEKIWNSIDGHLQDLVLPTFGAFDNFKEKTIQISSETNEMR